MTAPAVSELTAAARTVVAALANDDDPATRERVDRALDRVAKLEESIALLMDADVDDVPLAPAEEDDDLVDVDLAPNPHEGIAAAQVSDKERSKLADDGKAMEDGSFPIRNTADLHNAIQAFGRAKDPAAAKRHIKKRARELGAEGVLPDSWD
jgi:hypothetical protein